MVFTATEAAHMNILALRNGLVWTRVDRRGRICDFVFRTSPLYSLQVSREEGGPQCSLQDHPEKTRPLRNPFYVDVI